MADFALGFGLSVDARLAKVLITIFAQSWIFHNQIADAADEIGIIAVHEHCWV